MHGFGEALDGTAAWILVGLGLAAWLVPNLDPEWLTGLPGWLDVPLAAAIGLPLYVCASGSTPLAAVLVAKALSPGAALAFLLTGPATNVTTFGVVRSLHGTRAAMLFAAAVGGGAIGLGYLVNLAFADWTLPVAAVGDDHSRSPLQIVALALVAAGFLASVLRLGVRGFLAPLFDVPNIGERGPEPGHGHQHGPSHGCCES